MRFSTSILRCLLFASVAACHEATPATQSKTDTMQVSAHSTALPDKKKFESVIDGKPTSLYTLTNHNGMKAAITNYGGRIVSLLIPDSGGHFTDVVVGFGSVEDYEKSTEPYFGATIGRYGNRIAKGKFSLDGNQYSLFTNNGANSLHGGKKGFQAVVWDAKQLNDSTLELHYLSKDMEEGFPGNLNVTVTYSLTADNGFLCNYNATTDKKTIVNLTNHAFFNLNGEGSGTVLNHTVQIFANEYLPVDSGLIPTGKPAPVKNTPFDFTSPITIGAHINDSNIQLKYGNGYDHNFILKSATLKDKMRHAAIVHGDKSGVTMDIYTEEPGLQFYSGNFMQGKNTFKSGAKDDFRTAFAMETQHYPDSPNQPSFPSTTLLPGQTYSTRSLYLFSHK